MTCGHCKESVESVLNAFDSVKKASVDLISGKVLIEGVDIEIDEIKGSFAEGLITKDVLSRKQELTKITASKEENLIQDANLSIFCQSLNTNIANVLDWTNNFPQIFLIPRSSRQVYDLVEMFNDEYISREEEVDFSNLKVPKGCEIMGYVI